MVLHVDDFVIIIFNYILPEQNMAFFITEYKTKDAVYFCIYFYQKNKYFEVDVQVPFINVR